MVVYVPRWKGVTFFRAFSTLNYSVLCVREADLGPGFDRSVSFWLAAEWSARHCLVPREFYPDRTGLP